VSRQLRGGFILIFTIGKPDRGPGVHYIWTQYGIYAKFAALEERHLSICSISLIAVRHLHPSFQLAPYSLTTTMSIHDVPFRVDGQFIDERRAIQDLTTLEAAYKESTWLRHSSLEPLVGDQNCPHLAQTYGLHRRSCLTVFVDVGDDTSYKCRFERCLVFTFKDLNTALKHLRQHHFGNRAFVCLPTNGTTW
jgi:hypothetical protein